MNIVKQHRNRHLIFYAVLTFIFILFGTALHAAEMSGNHAKTYRFEIRKASAEPVEGWESISGLGGPGQTIWISTEAALTNTDVVQASVGRGFNDYPVITLLFTQDGALKFAKLTKSQIGKPVAMMIDGRVMAAPRIMEEITGGRAIINGNFSEEEARSIADGIMVRENSE